MIAAAGTWRWCPARRSARARAAEGAGEYRNQQSLELLLGRFPELGPDRRESQPVQHSGRAARAERQLLGLDVRKVRLKHPTDIGPNPVEPGIESAPSFWRIDSGPGYDAHHREITTAGGQRADHRSREGRGQRLERRLRAHCAHRLLLSVQVTLQR